MSDYRILVTGSREWSNAEVMKPQLQYLYYGALRDGRRPVLVHGAARGADSMANMLWFAGTGLLPEAHPADWDTHGKAAGFIRNQEMVDRGADVCLAFLVRAAANRGTRDCMGRAGRAGIPVMEVWDVWA